MKKMMLFLVCVTLILLTGCVKNEQKESKVPTENVMEETEKKEQPEEKKPILTTEEKEPQKEEATDKKSGKEQKPQKEEKSEVKEPKKNKKPAKGEEKPEKETSPKKDGSKKKEKEKSYSPQKVVSLATQKVKAGGKVLLTENLEQLLKDGSITKEEYEEYYPYDGAGYYSVYVETDLRTAQTTSGKRLQSVDAIAGHIADMLLLESGDYFLIEYAGVYTLNGTKFYEFRCYRA